MSERPLTLGTAGHIDHGKTALVKALTGRDTDRLKEEKERGISIELGFAELSLPSGRHLSVVDVPGHERFVRTMVAGATGIDAFMLVVAADDGVMPQTREHLRIIELLGIPAGVVALTKIDTVEPDMVELAQADVEDLLAATRYADSPVVPVSSVTGAGLPALLETLDRVAGVIPVRPAYPATRMPIDRVFSLKGVGTVVTGTLWSGELTPEDLISILPGRKPATPGQMRVRSIQVHDRPVEVAYGGQRVALNLTGVERQAVERGQWVVKDPAIDPTYLTDCRVTLLAELPENIPRISRARVDHGTKELHAKLVLADRTELGPGDSCFAQLRFDEKALVCPGDPFILRSVTPVTTIGGGLVIDPSPRKHGTDARWRGRLELLEGGPPDDIAALLLKETFPDGVGRKRLELSPYLWRFDGAGAVRSVIGDGRAVEGAQHRLFDAAGLAALESRLVTLLEQRADREPLNPYLSVGDVRREVSGGLEWPALDAAVERLQERGQVVRDEHGVRAASALVAVYGEDAARLDRLVSCFAQDGAEPPGLEVAAASAGMSPAQAAKAVQSLTRQGRLVKVGEDLYYEATVLADLMDRIAGAMEQAGQLTLAEVRDLLGTSRRYAQALLEHMDSEGRTLRVGDARRLRRRRR